MIKSVNERERKKATEGQEVRSIDKSEDGCGGDAELTVCVCAPGWKEGKIKTWKLCSEDWIRAKSEWMHP